MSESWQRYAAPAAFLLAVTIAVVLVRSGLESGASRHTTTAAVTTGPNNRATTTAPVTTTSPGKRPAAKRFYIVLAGDTFGVISRKTGVPVATIEQLNPNVASTSLHLGQRIRIR